MVTLDSRSPPGTDRCRLLGWKSGQPRRLCGQNAAEDIAAIRVTRTGLSPVTFGSSANVKLAQWAIVIGSPLDFQNSISLGIVSGLNRTLDTGGGQF